MPESVLFLMGLFSQPLSSTEVYLTLGIGNGRSVKSPYDFE